MSRCFLVDPYHEIQKRKGKGKDPGKSLWKAGLTEIPCFHLPHADPSITPEAIPVPMEEDEHISLFAPSSMATETTQDYRQNPQNTFLDPEESIRPGDVDEDVDMPPQSPTYEDDVRFG